MDDCEYDRCQWCFNTGFARWLEDNGYEDGRWFVHGERTESHKVEDDYYVYLDVDGEVSQEPVPD